MANRLNIPEDLEQLVEKRENDRRQPNVTEPEKSSAEALKGKSNAERRRGSGRRAEDRK